MRASRRIAFAAACAAAAAVAVFAWRVPTNVHPPRLPLANPGRAQELVVLVRPNPVVYFPGRDGRSEGLDADLLRLYAAEKKLPVRFVAIDDVAQLKTALGNGDGHVGAGGLLRPPATASQAPTGPPGPPEGAPPTLRWTGGYFTVEPVLVYNTDGFRPANWADLDGELVAFSDIAGLEAEIDALRSAHPDIRWQFVPQASPVELIARVSDGAIGYAIAGSLASGIARNIYLDFDVAFSVGGKRPFSWAVPERFPELAADLDRFIERVKRDGTLARLIERYVPELRQFQRLDASGLQERVRTALPQYRQHFRDAQEKTGIDWRLLAALAYQESKWDPAATSETGVRGFMQITEDTARRLGVTNLLDPAQNVLAGARYLRDLKDKLPARIQEPDRTWLALAAYNIGLGHLEDARVLAQRQGFDPDHWTNVKRALPLLAIPEHYEKAKLGYARGGMPVAFVDRVRGYYDVLLAHQAPMQPRLRLFADTPAGETRDAVPAKN
ncbi:MAG: membrane-bound lytic murein transglycosylase MltF [Casimicrobiaceae bacterium]